MVTMEKFWSKAPTCSSGKEIDFLQSFLLTPGIGMLMMKQPHVLHLTMKASTKQEIVLTVLVMITILMAGFHVTVSFFPDDWCALYQSQVNDECQGIRFHEYTIPIIELELRLMDLPYISEAHVLPVLDHETGGLVAALVRLQKQTVNQIFGDITLRRIREDLAARNMASYKLPVLLRVLRDDEQVPLTASGKTLKKESLRKYFNISGYLPDQYAVDGVENWGNKLDTAASTRLFDWGGL
jgi:hypothetical protein